MQTVHFKDRVVLTCPAYSFSSHLNDSSYIVNNMCFLFKTLSSLHPQQNLDRKKKTHSFPGKGNRRVLSKLQNASCIWYIVVIHNGDNRRLRWTKSNFSEVLFRLQREQAPWQILGTETNSSYSNYSRLRARGQQHDQYSYPQLAEPLSPCKT